MGKENIGIMNGPQMGGRRYKDYKLILDPKKVDGFLKCVGKQSFQLAFQGSIIGALIGGLSDRTFHILCVEILSAARHKGHGKIFVELVERHVIRLGANFLQADEVEPDDGPFWAKLGFKGRHDPERDTLIYHRQVFLSEKASG